MQHNAKDLDNLERAKLLHIILTANELGGRLRRSARKEVTIPVRLSSDKLGGAWEENAETVMLSRYGAAVKCTRAAKLGDLLQIQRSDTGQATEARVAWRQDVDNDIWLGVEFVGCDNFWGIDWGIVDEHS
jgi:hypothetical protein